MREMQDVARTFFELRRELLNRENTMLSRHKLHAQVETLAWVLGIEPGLFPTDGHGGIAGLAPREMPAVSAAAVPSLVEISEVGATWVHALSCVYVEFPATRVGSGDDAFTSQYWAAFLGENQARDLIGALVEAMAPRVLGRQFALAALSASPSSPPAVVPDDDTVPPGA